MSKPKFEIGQKVFVFTRDGVTTREITCVARRYKQSMNCDIQVLSRLSEDCFMYSFDKMENPYYCTSWLEEYKIFATKEELKNSI